MNWYELEEGDRIKQFYSKYSIQEFWDWWSGGDSKVMEVRIKDYKLLRETADKFKVPYSTSGVYVNNATSLKQIIGYVRDKATIWFGINPRKKNKNLKGWSVYGSGPQGGSADINVDEICFLFIDIDRVDKNGLATNEDLKNCDILANNILERLSKEKWNNSYCKICSGNGVQLLIKLDESLVVPNIIFKKIELIDSKMKYGAIPIENSEYLSIKNIISEGIGKEVYNFCKKLKIELNVEVDKKTFNLSRVGALPFSKNIKHGSFRWRGILEIKKEENEGFSDYILTKKINIKEFKERNVFSNRKYSQLKLNPKKLRQNEIIKLMLENQLSYGEINNVPWCQFKCLVRDSKNSEEILNSDDYKIIKKELEIKYKGMFSSNLPKEDIKYNPMTIWKYCVRNNIIPVYNFSDINKNIDIELKIKNRDLWRDKEIYGEEKKYKLEQDTTEFEDIDNFKLYLNENNLKGYAVVSNFLVSFEQKYGTSKAKFFADNILKDYLSYDSNIVENKNGN